MALPLHQQYANQIFKEQFSFSHLKDKIINKNVVTFHEYLYVILKLIEDPKFEQLKKLENQQLAALVAPYNLFASQKNFTATSLKSDSKSMFSPLFEHISETLCSLLEALHDKDFAMADNERKQIMNSIQSYNYYGPKNLFKHYQTLIESDIYGSSQNQSIELIQFKLQKNLNQVPQVSSFKQFFPKVDISSGPKKKTVQDCQKEQQNYSKELQKYLSDLNKCGSSPEKVLEADEIIREEIRNRKEKNSLQASKIAIFKANKDQE